MNSFDVIIVGAGPAGSAAALRLLQSQPGYHILVLDKAAFPRTKLCGGGITRAAEAALGTLGVAWNIPAIPVTSVEFRVPPRTFRIHSGRFWPGYVFQIIRRDAFDQNLLTHAARWGATVRDGEEALAVTVHRTGAMVSTAKGEYEARAVIVSDGANSPMRRHLGLTRPRCLGAAIEVLSANPNDTSRTMTSREHHARFDFSPATRGIQGYYWEFPTAVNGVPMISRGVADSRIIPTRQRSNLRAELDDCASFPASGGDPPRGAALRWYHPLARHSTSRVVFAGDAVGMEPFFDEGISTALEGGIFAADAVLRAIEAGDLSFASYDSDLRRSVLGRTLLTKLALARRFYSPHIARWQYVPLTWTVHRWHQTVDSKLRGLRGSR